MKANDGRKVNGGVYDIPPRDIASTRGKPLKSGSNVDRGLRRNALHIWNCLGCEMSLDEFKGGPFDCTQRTKFLALDSYLANVRSISIGARNREISGNERYL